MATLVLQAAGTAIGGLFGPIGAALGAAVGGMAGAAIDQALLAKTGRREGPRLDGLRLMNSVEGAPIPRVFGTMRVGGQVIWATALQEEVARVTSGPKGARTTTTTYSYSANFAVALCEGPVAAVRRVWADGKPFDLSAVVTRLHRGDETGLPDPLIVAKEGAGNAPAYRGIAYLVFEGLRLEEFGNRIPQFTFEVVKPVGGLETGLRAVSLIPGAGEFVYEDRVVTENLGPGSGRTVNAHTSPATADFVASVDELLAICPNLQRVSLVVSWFGDDLRAGHCTVRPKVDAAGKDTTPVVWSVAGQTRDTATLVSTLPDGTAAYGGTPSDASIVRAIAHLKSRGVAVTLYPFLMMDIPAGNTLPNPQGGLGQPAYPWRGRITCHPAPGIAGSPDGTAAAAGEVAAFFGTAAPAHYTIASGVVSYAGPTEWTWRRMVLHCAALANLAGGVEAFVIGSELVGLTRVRSASGIYPAVAALVSLAGDVKAMLGTGTKVVYGADWTEYGAHVLAGGAEVRFPLDPLFGSAAIDAVALDWYAPLADWRDGPHLDAAAASSIHDRDYLAANVAGGEGYDWFYASDVDRVAQSRTPILDGLAGKHWVFRPKDLVGWWSNAHRERVGGAELGATTAWVPGSKPIWLLELGCPAVDKGANRPSVFPDPKSVESGLPPFSNGQPDPLIMTRAIEALIDRFDPSRPRFVPSGNPVASLYGGRMVDASRLYVWAWDARPYPAFPQGGIWGDSANHRTGHWLNGRADAVPLDRLVEAIASEPGLSIDASRLAGLVAGAAIERIASARDVIEPIGRLMGFSATDRDGTLTFRPLAAEPALPVAADRLVFDGEARDAAALVRRRAQESELPRSLAVVFADADNDHLPAAEQSRRLDTASRRDARLEVGLALSRGEASRRADILLQDTWIARDTVSFGLPRSFLALETGDLVALLVDGRQSLIVIERLADRGGVREVEARRVEPAIFAAPLAVAAVRPWRPAETLVRPKVALLDLPARAGAETVLQWLAVTARPWPGSMTLWRSAGDGEFEPVQSLTRPATMGRLLTALETGPSGRFDRANSAVIAIDGTGDLFGRPDLAVLGGANMLAARRSDGSLEMLQFLAAELVGERMVRISGLLRGQNGSDGAMATLPPGTEVVLVDDALVPLTRDVGDLGRPAVWRVGSSRLEPGDPAMAEIATAPLATTLRPWPVVHPRAHRSASGVTIAFRRRSRVGGDRFDDDIPLGEPAEAYVVDVLAGPAVVRTLTTATPELLYAAATEIADFGAPQSTLTVRIVQLGADGLRGFPREVILDVQ